MNEDNRMKFFIEVNGDIHNSPEVHLMQLLEAATDNMKIDDETRWRVAAWYNCKYGIPSSLVLAPSRGSHD